ncbi:hypothetical protein AD998_11165 [bacterium 336/3]|nr:hypothetical protein AD998_11165 [bacterium 336/3]
MSNFYFGIILDEKQAKINIMKNLILLFLFVSNLLYAQDFQVLTSNGNNLIKLGNKKIWAGTALKNADVITVAQNGYLGLMHLKTGKTIEIKKAGTYTMSTLTPKTGNSSLGPKYSSYVAEELFKGEKQDINKNHRKYMAITGAVSRDSRVLNEAKTLTVFTSDGAQEVYDNFVYLSWMPNSNDKIEKYYIQITNFNDETVALLETDKNYLELDMSIYKRAKNSDATFIIKVFTVEAPLYKGVFTVSLMDKTKKEGIKKEIGSTTPENALDYMIMAKYFEEKGLLLDAVKCYQKALALQNLDSYKNAYMEFLSRNKIGYTLNPDFKD